MDYKILICFFSCFQFSSLMLIKELKPGFDKKFRFFEINIADYVMNDCFEYPSIPNLIGQKLLREDVVIRTFPSESSLYHENTEYTKNMRMELEKAFGTSKSSFDKTDVVMLTLIEKDVNNVTSNIIKSIKVDPLSVDFYPLKVTMEQFNVLVSYERYSKPNRFCKSVCTDLSRGYEVDPKDYHRFRRECPKISCPSILEDIDYPKMFAEMEKFIRTMKYLILFDYSSPTCKKELLAQWTVLELDNKTVSLFPKLTSNHYFIVTFIDIKKKQTKTRKIDECRIILN